MSPLLPIRLGLAAAVLALVAACGESSAKQNEAAYTACLSSAKADAKIAKAQFAAFKDAKIGA